METIADINLIRDTFKDMSCLSEELNDSYFAMEIPADKDYTPVRQKLTQLETAGVIGYAGPCLAKNHWYD